MFLVSVKTFSRQQNLINAYTLFWGIIIVKLHYIQFLPIVICDRHTQTNFAGSRSPLVTSHSSRSTLTALALRNTYAQHESKSRTPTVAISSLNNDLFSNEKHFHCRALQKFENVLFEAQAPIPDLLRDMLYNRSAINRKRSTKSCVQQFQKKSNACGRSATY